MLFARASEWHSEGSRFDPDHLHQRQSSAQEKENYFLNHKVKKCPDKTLHHIVPLDLWVDLDDFKLLDDWRNMIYIKNEKHTSLHRLNPTPCFLDVKKDTLFLRDNLLKTVELKNGSDVVYSCSKTNIMIEYNKDMTTNRTI